MRCAIIGDGGWGTALALTLESTGNDVAVWGIFPEYIEKIKNTSENIDFLPGIEIPAGITWTSDRNEAVSGAELVVLAVPTRHYSEVAASFGQLVPKTARIVSVAKGLEQDSRRRMTEVAAEIFPENGIAALSGPSHAEEVARRIPTAVTIASPDPALNTELQDSFSTRHFRVYTSDDVIGVELGGALKNVIAIAVGVCDGMGFGDNTRAALITRGLAEITRLGCALGAKPETFAGLSGMGDLIVTCTSGLSRNRAVGERLGKGENIQDILNSMKQVAEGVHNCTSAFELAQSKGVEVPITEQVCAVIQDGMDPRKAVESLLARETKPE